MSFKKFVLVDPNTLDKGQNIKNEMSKLDREMQTILGRSDLSDSQKWTLYRKILDSYLDAVSAGSEYNALPQVDFHSILESSSPKGEKSSIREKKSKKSSELDYYDIFGENDRRHIKFALDKKIREILDRKDLTDQQKWTFYRMLLNLYIEHVSKNKNLISMPVFDGGSHSEKSSLKDVSKTGKELLQENDKLGKQWEESQEKGIKTMESLLDDLERQIQGENLADVSIKEEQEKDKSVETVLPRRGRRIRTSKKPYTPPPPPKAIKRKRTSKEENIQAWTPHP